MREVVAYCRETGGPASVELDTERYFGHFEGDPQRYRGAGELDRLRAERDCLAAFRRKVSEAGLLDEAVLDEVDAEVLALIDEAVAEAKASPPPQPQDVLEDVYISY